MTSFLWGAATSSHQIEGNNIHNDWWHWEAQGKIEDGSISGRATDHWNRFREDIRHLADLKLNSYRFSVEWSRIEPREGVWDEAALDWYSEMLAECERWDVLPMLTLHHFTLPQWVAERGGLTWRDISKRFGIFTRKVVSRFGSRVPLWCTVNEPMGLVAGQYLAGFMPPAKNDPEAAAQACHHLLKCHVAAYDIIHREMPTRKGPWRDHPLMVGVAHNMIDFLPARDWHPIDRLATKIFHQVYNRAWLDAITGLPQRFGVRGVMPNPQPVTEALGRRTVDYMGINYYLKAYLRWRPKGGHYETSPDFPLGMAFSDGIEKVSEMGWAVHPLGLGRMIRRVSQYGLPIYITENGIADKTDELRQPYLVLHLKEIAKAVAEGADVRGYYYWSLLDNFEWIKGFAPRFGLIEVDYQNFERRRRASADLYAEIVREHQAQDKAFPSQRILAGFPSRL